MNLECNMNDLKIKYNVNVRIFIDKEKIISVIFITGMDYMWDFLRFVDRLFNQD